jgi:GNAT superfamily N-acetyltransferase
MGQNEINKIGTNKNPIIHHNEWWWGISETIIAGQGVAICKVSIENNDMSVAWLSDVSIVPAYRGRGYGNELLYYAIQRAQVVMRAKILYLRANPHDWPIEWYKRHGFVFDYTDENGNSVLKLDLTDGR